MQKDLRQGEGYGGAAGPVAERSYPGDGLPGTLPQKERIQRQEEKILLMSEKEDCAEEFSCNSPLIYILTENKRIF